MIAHQQYDLFLYSEDTTLLMQRYEFRRFEGITSILVL